MGLSGSEAARQSVAPHMHVTTRDNNLMALILFDRFFVHSTPQGTTRSGVFFNSIFLVLQTDLSPITVLLVFAVDAV